MPRFSVSLMLSTCRRGISGWRSFCCLSSSRLSIGTHNLIVIKLCIAQIWEWQLEELALYFLLYTEAANLRHLPEALWFLFWILRNSPHKMAQARLARDIFSLPARIYI